METSSSETSQVRFVRNTHLWLLPAPSRIHLSFEARCPVRVSPHGVPSSTVGRWSLEFQPLPRSWPSLADPRSLSLLPCSTPTFYSRYRSSPPCSWRATRRLPEVTRYPLPAVLLVVPQGPAESFDSRAVRASREDSFSLECLASDITTLTRPLGTQYLGEDEPPPRDARRPPPPGSLTPSTVFLQRGLRVLQRSRTRFMTFLGRLGSPFHRRRWTGVRLDRLPPTRMSAARAGEAPSPSCFTPLEECHPHSARPLSPPNRSPMFTSVAALLTLRGRVPCASVGMPMRARLQGLVPCVRPSLDPTLPPGCRSPLLPWVSGSPSRPVARLPLAATRTRG
jgi:hypothetical protein